ncbi:MAG TPA: ABC transporter ATP-binding protein [Cyclobacteriaceae bacterium]|nr:ABC transporter ATP-binding protein [Cyclobacteriaceae bacterium]
MQNITLRTQSLTIGYKSGNQSICLFEDLSLQLQQQQLVCFMGPNGAGKSTLIRTLAGLQEPLRGKVEILADPHPISTSATVDVAHSIAVVLTDRIATNNLTVRDLVTFGRYPYLDWTIRLHQRDDELITKAIAEVNIEYLEEKKIFELSDGQLQMVMIARALAQDTPIILLDEPTAHLDLNNRIEIMKTLKHLTRKKNKTVLLATHDLDLALQTADAIWLTGKNKNILTGIPEDLVLNGMFDSIFEFKGFDLKTGKVIHTSFQKFNVKLSGQGHFFLWTKNALERTGYRLDPDADLEISTPETEELLWKIFYQGNLKEVTSISDLLNHLQTI